MPLLQQTMFGGLMPIQEPRNLPPANAQVAENVDLSAGNLRAFKCPLLTTTLPDASRLSIFKNGTDWLSWLLDVNVVRGQLHDDQYERIYATGDGVPKVHGFEVTPGATTLLSTKKWFHLGIPKPSAAPTVTIGAKTATSWTRTWHYFYEDADGTQYDAGTFTEGTEVVESTAGSIYTVASIPARVLAPATAKFVMWFDGYTAAGKALGRLYPNISMQRGNTDMYVDGAIVTGTQVNGATAVLTLAYDTDDASDYTKDRTFVYTFVSAWGEEGPPSDPSEVVAVMPTESATLSAIDTTISEDNDIRKVYIYRTVTGSAGANYYFVDEITFGTATYTDDVLDEDTNELLTSSTLGVTGSSYDAPPTDMFGLMAHPGRFFVGFSGKTVCFSEPGYPHAWPTRYRQQVDFDIVGGGIFGTTVAVLTKGNAYLGSGSAPEEFVGFSKMAEPQACVSKRGILCFENDVLYPSPDGLISVASGIPVNITSQNYSHDNWQALSPSTMVGAVHDKNIFLFSSSASLIITYSTAAIIVTTTTETATGFYTDAETDALYMIQGMNIMQWNAGLTNLKKRWRSKEYAVSRPFCPTVARITGDGYTATKLRLLANNAQVLEVGVDDDEAFRLSVLDREKTWSYEAVSESDNDTEVLLSQSMSDL